MKSDLPFGLLFEEQPTHQTEPISGIFYDPAQGLSLYTLDTGEVVPFIICAPVAVAITDTGTYTKANADSEDVDTTPTSPPKPIVRTQTVTEARETTDVDY